MPKFEYKTSKVADVETIMADSYNLDTKVGKLTFYDKQNNHLAAFAIDKGAYVKLVNN